MNIITATKLSRAAWPSLVRLAAFLGIKAPAVETYAGRRRLVERCERECNRVEKKRGAA